MTRHALILHGGAGARPERDYAREVDNMRAVVEAMKIRLDGGATALDVAVEATVMLEDSGLDVAGRGASPNLAGAYELDASLMDGSTRKAGAVAALQGFRNPVRAARAVMDRTPPRDAGRRGCGPVRPRPGTGDDRRRGGLVHPRRQGRGQSPAWHFA